MDDTKPIEYLNEKPENFMCMPLVYNECKDNLIKINYTAVKHCYALCSFNVQMI